MNKNKLIAVALDSIANQMKYIADLLDQPDKVPASTNPVPGFGYSAPWKGYTAKDIADNNRKVVAAVPPYVPTAAGIPKHAEFVSENRQKPVYSPLAQRLNENPNIKGECVHLETVENKAALQEIYSNRRNIFYKIVLGSERGAVLVINRWSRKVVRDGRMNASTKSNDQLALVSKDSDGIAYAQAVRRALLVRGYNKRGSRLVRYYRPNAAGKGNYKMAAIYRKNRRNWGGSDK